MNNYRNVAKCSEISYQLLSSYLYRKIVDLGVSVTWKNKVTLALHVHLQRLIAFFQAQPSWFRAAQAEGTEFRVSASYLEIYNEVRQVSWIYPARIRVNFHGSTRRGHGTFLSIIAIRSSETRGST